MSSDLEYNTPSQFIGRKDFDLAFLQEGLSHAGLSNSRLDCHLRG
jgi:hypothetical protein